MAKLSDLEYAKDVTSDNPPKRPQDIKTAFFRAVEIEAGTLLFEPEAPQHDLFNLVDSLEVVQPTVVFPLRYRYLHDLESVFWIRTLHTLHPPSDDKLDNEISNSRLHDLNSLFPYPTGRIQDTFMRSDFLKRTPSAIRITTLDLPEKLKMALTQFLAIALDLTKEYDRVERNLMDLVKEKPVRLYRNAHAYLGVLVRSVKDGVWLGNVVRLDEKVSAGDKRKPGADDDGPSAKKARHD